MDQMILTAMSGNGKNLVFMSVNSMTQTFTVTITTMVITILTKISFIKGSIQQQVAPLAIEEAVLLKMGAQPVQRVILLAHLKQEQDRIQILVQILAQVKAVRYLATRVLQVIASQVAATQLVAALEVDQALLEASPVKFIKLGEKNDV
jgi:hypothetical protein